MRSALFPLCILLTPRRGRLRLLYHAFRRGAREVAAGAVFAYTGGMYSSFSPMRGAGCSPHRAEGRRPHRGIPSVDKGKHGFDGQKCAHTASNPLTIRQVFSAGLSLSGHISAPAKLYAPASDGFSSDFWLLRRRRAGARQGEKGKKRRKDTLSGVFALVN